MQALEFLHHVSSSRCSWRPPGWCSLLK